MQSSSPKPEQIECFGDAIKRLSCSLAEVRLTLSTPGAVERWSLYDAMTGAPVEGDGQKLLLQALTTLDMSANSANGSVIRFPGLFEVSPGLGAQLEAMNSAKHALESAAKALISAGIGPRHMRLLYSRFGYGRIHPLQAWRQINILQREPLRVGFTVAKSTSSIERLSLIEALQRLQRMGALDIAEQLENLQPLASVHWHTPISRHIRANITWRESPEKRLQRMLHASLPFVVYSGGWPKDGVFFSQPREHAQRRDKKGGVVLHLPFRDGAFLVAVPTQPL